MPWRPGFKPVEKVDHDTGVCDGIVDSSGAKLPCLASFARLGSLPSSIHFRVSLASAPSKPRITSLREAPGPEAAGAAAAGPPISHTSTAAASSRAARRRRPDAMRGHCNDGRLWCMVRVPHDPREGGALYQKALFRETLRSALGRRRREFGERRRDAAGAMPRRLSTPHLSAIRNPFMPAMG